MAYGGGPGDSLSQLMRKNERKPMGTTTKPQQVTLTQPQIQEIYQKIWTNTGNMTVFTKEER